MLTQSFPATSTTKKKKASKAACGVNAHKSFGKPSFVGWDAFVDQPITVSDGVMQAAEVNLKYYLIYIYIKILQ